MYFCIHIRQMYSLYRYRQIDIHDIYIDYTEMDTQMKTDECMDEGTHIHVWMKAHIYTYVPHTHIYTCIHMWMSGYIYIYIYIYMDMDMDEGRHRRIDVDVDRLV
jgi:hypothetical protein